MGGVATAELASAVALAGALGMIGGVRLGAKVLGEELDSLPRQTRSRIGVNFLVPFLDRESLEVAASRVRVVEFFYGEPDADLVERAHGAGALAAWQVGSVEEARAARAPKSRGSSRLALWLLRLWLRPEFWIPTAE